MATEAIAPVPAEPEGEAAEGAAPPKKSRVVLMLAAGGLLVGAAVGGLALGPALINRAVARPPVVDSSAVAGPPVLYALENLVLNPAGSNGMRFLLVNASLEVKDVKTQQTIRDRDPEVRDRVLALLGSLTVAELTDMSKRESIKQRVLDTVRTMVPPGTVRRVFFPQFVIQ